MSTFFPLNCNHIILTTHISYSILCVLVSVHASYHLVDYPLLEDTDCFINLSKIPCIPCAKYGQCLHGIVIDFSLAVQA